MLLGLKKSRKSILFFLLLVIQFGCKTNLTYLGKNPYKEPVYNELLALDEVQVADIEAAFEAYLSTHEMDKHSQKWVRKQIGQRRQHANNKGYYVSPELQYRNLLAFRNPTPNENVAGPSMLPMMPPTIPNTIPNPNGKGAWKNLGPFGIPDVRWSASGNGALDFLELHPTDPNTMYVCARNAGLHKTTDNGQTWKNITAHFPTANMFCVDVNDGNPNVIYAGGGKSNIFYSADGGVVWEDRSTGLSRKIYRVHSDPTNSNRVIAVSLGGIFVSTDAGLTWTKKVTGEFTDMEFKEDFSLLVAARDDNNQVPLMYYSTDKGDTWRQKMITSNYTTVDKIYLALHENNSGNDVIMAFGLKNSNTPTRFIGLWKSSYIPNPGAGQDTFNFISVKHPTYSYPNGPVLLSASQNPPGYTEYGADTYGGINLPSTQTYIGEFWISPNDTNHVLTASQKMWGAEDGGVIWEYKPSYGEAHWADVRHIRMNNAKDTVYLIDDGGIWCIAESDLFPSPTQVTASGLSKYDYMTSKVKSKIGNLSLQEGTQMDVSMINKDVFMTGGQDLGQFYQRAGRTTHVASADIYRGRIKPDEDQYFITGRLNIVLADGSSAQVYNGIEADQGNSDRLYGFTETINGVNNAKLVRSPLGVDGWQVQNFVGEKTANADGGSWTSKHNNWEIVTFNGTGITSFRGNSFEQSKANPELAFYGDEIGKKLFYTENLSAANPTWIQLPNAPSSDLYRIATHDIYENIVVIATETGVYVSKNKGIDWFLKPKIPEFNFQRIALDKNEQLGIYAMTDMNVYYYTESNSKWQEFNKGLPLFQNVDLRIGYYENGDNRIYINKYGSGVWSSPLQSVLDANQNLPIADFKIHGNSADFLIKGSTAQLIDLSVNADSLLWVIENGSDIITISNDKYPKAVLNTPGYYKVTLTAKNANGNDIEIKENYIYVYDEPTLSCTPSNTLNIAWYVGLNKITLDGDTYNDISLANYQSKNKVFNISNQAPNHIVLKDNFIPGYNFWWKAYIDFNNDGIFTLDERLFNSGAPVDSVNTTFNIPPTATFNIPLHFRISGRGNSLEPDSCGIYTGANADNRHVIDMKVILSNALTITQTDLVVAPATVNLESTYTGGKNISGGGFLLSTVDGSFDKDNATIHPFTGTMANNGTFNMSIDGLMPNTIYYYKPYLIDAGRYSYGVRDSFYIPKKVFPIAEAVIALDRGNQELELQGMLFPNNINIAALAFMHGENNFANVTPMDTTINPTVNKQHLKTVVTVPSSFQTYQFKLRIITAEGDTFYSNIASADIKKPTYCSPTVSNPEWYMKWVSINLNGVTFNGNTNDYQDATSTTFDLETGVNYTTTLTYQPTGWYYMDFYVLIDFNDDRDFDDAGEVVGSGTEVAQNTKITIKIPTRYNLRGKKLRMRVIGNYDNTMNACSLQKGSVKDFTVHLDRCKPVRIVDVGDTPFADGKEFWAQDSVIVQGNLVLPNNWQILMDAPEVRVKGKLETSALSRLEVDKNGCIVE